MAYSNWGGFVFFEGEHRPDKEDVGVFDTDEAHLPSGARIFANLTKQLADPEGETPWYKHSHHVVLGDGNLRWCGYKYRPELWLTEAGAVADVDVDRYVIDRDSDGPLRWEGVYDGWQFAAWYISNESGMGPLHMQLSEPDGRLWEARMAMTYGAGFNGSHDHEIALSEYMVWGLRRG